MPAVLTLRLRRHFVQSIFPLFLNPSPISIYLSSRIILLSHSFPASPVASVQIAFRSSLFEHPSLNPRPYSSSHSMFFFSPILLGAFSLSLLQRCHSAAIEQQSPTTTTSSRAIAHNPYSTGGPFPVLEIGYQHIISQIGSNATAAGNTSLPDNIRQQFATTKIPPIQELDAVQCSPNQPCADGSCCNSVSEPEISLGS